MGQRATDELKYMHTMREHVEEMVGIYVAKAFSSLFNPSGFVHKLPYVAVIKTCRCSCDVEMIIIADPFAESGLLSQADRPISYSFLSNLLLPDRRQGTNRVGIRIGGAQEFLLGMASLNRSAFHTWRCLGLISRYGVDGSLNKPLDAVQSVSLSTTNVRVFQKGCHPAFP